MTKRNRGRRERRASSQRAEQLEALKTRYRSALEAEAIDTAQTEGKNGSKWTFRGALGMMGLMLYGQAVKLGDGVTGTKIPLLDSLPNIRGHVPNLLDVPSHGSNAVASTIVAWIMYSGFKRHKTEANTLETVNDYYQTGRRAYISMVVGAGTLVNLGMEGFSGVAAAESESSQRLLGGFDPVDVAYGALWAGAIARSQMGVTQEHLAEYSRNINEHLAGDGWIQVLSQAGEQPS